MSDDMFDLGDPADDAPDDTGGTGETGNTGNNADNASNEGTGDMDVDPQRTPAYETDYRSNQHTVAALDETWQELTDLLENARAYSKLAGYSDVSRLEAYEAMFQLVLDDHEAEAIADAIQQARHAAHGDSEETSS